MKLLFFIGSLAGGGAERVMVIICNELVKRGHEVYLATNTDIPFAYDLDDRVKTINLFENYNKESGKLTRNTRLFKTIRSIAKEVMPDIMIPFMFSISTQVILSTVDMKIPVISSEHNTFDKNQTFIQYIKRFHINRLAKRTVILTKSDYDFLGNRLKNKVVIPNPLSFEINKGNKSRSKSVLAAGHIDRWEHKGFDNLIKVWGRVSSKFPDWKLEIAGNGKKESFDFLNTIAKKHNVEHSVEFLGFQSNLDNLLQEKSIFILSSRWEGMPMILLEAMSQGSACVSFDCTTGPREIITHNESGILVENQNMEAMEKALIKLMSDEELRNKLSEGGLKESERFTPNKIVDKWEELFDEVIRK